MRNPRDAVRRPFAGRRLAAVHRDQGALARRMRDNPGGRAHLDACRRRAREPHHADVLATAPPDRLPVFDIDRDPPDALCRCAGLPACARHFTVANRTGVLRPLARRAVKVLPAPLRPYPRRLPRRLTGAGRRGGPA